MKDCGYALRKAYYDKLTSASYSLGVYDTISLRRSWPWRWNSEELAARLSEALKGFSG